VRASIELSALCLRGCGYESNREYTFCEGCVLRNQSAPLPDLACLTWGTHVIPDRATASRFQHQLCATSSAPYPFSALRVQNFRSRTLNLVTGKAVLRYSNALHTRRSQSTMSQTSDSKCQRSLVVDTLRRPIEHLDQITKDFIMSASVNVLVTGFGVRKRPCIPHVLQLMSSAVPRNDQQPFLDNRTRPTIVSAYHKILAQVPTLIQDNASDLVVHMGLDPPSAFRRRKERRN